VKKGLVNKCALFKQARNGKLEGENIFALSIAASLFERFYNQKNWRQPIINNWQIAV
jgi:hypothetical protein